MILILYTIALRKKAAAGHDITTNGLLQTQSESEI